MAAETMSKTLIVSTLLCIVCSTLVSTTAVFLRPRIERNKELDKKSNILSCAGLLKEGKDIEETFKQLEPIVVELATGEVVTDKSVVDPNTYDQRQAAKDPQLNHQIPKDMANKIGIKTRAKYAVVYQLKQEGKLVKLILPVHGKGLWSTLYGFLALASDLKTIKGFAFYQHGETPGLGGEVDNPRWKQQCIGKVVYDENWQPVIEVIKGAVDPNVHQDHQHKLDGLSGATLTSNGVTYLLQYWLGVDGFAPYIEKLRQGGAQ